MNPVYNYKFVYKIFPPFSTNNFNLKRGTHFSHNYPHSKLYICEILPGGGILVSRGLSWGGGSVMCPSPGGGTLMIEGGADTATELGTANVAGATSATHNVINEIATHH